MLFSDKTIYLNPIYVYIFNIHRSRTIIWYVEHRGILISHNAFGMGDFVGFLLKMTKFSWKHANLGPISICQRAIQAPNHYMKFVGHLLCFIKMFIWHEQGQLVFSQIWAEKNLLKKHPVWTTCRNSQKHGRITRIVYEYMKALISRHRFVLDIQSW